MNCPVPIIEDPAALSLVETAGSSPPQCSPKGPDGESRALGSLGDFHTSAEAYNFAIKCGKAAVDGRDYRSTRKSRRKPH